MEWLLSWEFVGVAVGVLVSIGFGVLSMSDFKHAKICFLIAAFIIEAEILMWGMQSHRSLAFRLPVYFICFGIVGVLAMEALRYVDRKRESKKVEVAPLQAATIPSQDPQLARIEFRTESAKALRDVRIFVKLNRTYSIQELGHFRLLFEVIDSDDPDFWIGAQDFYSPNITMKDKKANQYGIRYSVRYRNNKNKFVPIPVYPKTQKYTGLISGSPLVDTFEFAIDLNKQIPSYKILDDLDRKILSVYITDSLISKISEISIVANNYVLISKKAELFKPDDNKPTINWFLPLSDADKAVRWRGIGLKDSTGQLEKVLGESASLAWQLDFSTSTPAKWTP